MATGKRTRTQITSKATFRAIERSRGMPAERADALAGEAFEMSDALQSLSRSKLRQITSGVSFPTRAAYWSRFDPARLKNSEPLPGARESKSAGKKRAAKARRYFAKVRSKRSRTNTKTQYRVHLKGTIEQIDPRTGAVTLSVDGSQSGPWLDVPIGGLTESLIRSAYLDVARYSVSINARGRPQFQGLKSQGFRRYRNKGNSPEAILYIDTASVETRQVPADTSAEG